MDILDDDIKVLFVGYNPSIMSGETGHHYANPNNRFWKILFQAGITDRKYAPEEDHTLLKKGLGFTNIVARPTKGAADITKEEYKEGRTILKDKIKRYKPRVVCFVGKGVYQQYAQKNKISWGKQDESKVLGVTDFVAPSSSGLVRMKLDEIVEIYQEITKLY